MNPISIQSPNKPEDAFFTEAMPLYLEAMVALADFRSRVHKECGLVLNNQLEPLSKTLGIAIMPSQIEPDIKPCGRGNAVWDSAHWDGSTIYIQVQLNLKNGNSDLSYISAGLEWAIDNGKSIVWPYTCLEFQTASDPRRLSEKLSDTNIYDGDSHCLTIYGDASGSNSGFPKAELEWTVEKWIRLLSKAKVFFKGKLNLKM